MKNYILLFMLTFFMISISAQGQEYKKQIALTTDLIFAGDLNSIYNTTVGAEAKYFFKESNKFNHFFIGGFTTDIGVDGANMYAVDLGLGTQYTITQLWNRNLYAKGSIGALYLHEKFSTTLIDQTISSSDSEFGFKASLGFGYAITKRIGVEFRANQYNSLMTTGSFALSFSF